MVKQAEKEEKKNPLTPVFGLMLALGLFLVAYIISGQIFTGKPIQGVKPVPQLASLVNSMGVYQTSLPDLSDPKKTDKMIIPKAQLLFAVAIWLVLLAIGYFLVAVLAGKDPDSAKDIPLPPRDKDKKKR